MAVSTFISGAAAENLLAAAGFADDLGLPLNRFLTINWTLADGSGNIPRRLAKLRERASKWLFRHGVPLTCCWVIEAPRDHWNSHMSIHLPPRLEKPFEAMIPRWIGGNNVAGLVHLKPTTTKGWRKYILKGIDPAEARRLGIRPERQGRIKGKRCGNSENIGPTAYERWILSHEDAEPVAT